MEIRTDRVGALLDQLVESKGLAMDRLSGLTTEEYLWEPYPEMWSVRPRVEAKHPTPSVPANGSSITIDRSTHSPLDR